MISGFGLRKSQTTRPDYALQQTRRSHSWPCVGPAVFTLNNGHATPMKVMRRKIEAGSFLLGAFVGAVAVLCVAATTKTNAGASGDTTAKAKEGPLEQVTGIGGVFFKVKDPKAMNAWYQTNLGIQSKGGYANFTWREKDHPEQIGHTAWRIFATNTTYFGQSPSSLMINYRVANLDRMLEQLRSSGVKIEKIEDHDFGRWAWIMDPEGNRIELWEPKKK
jgi:predicted enzyme related to lactoylglutathione lyase